MGRRFLSAESRQWRFQCLFLLIGLICVLPGCNPQAISMLLRPWMDDKVEPEYKLFSADKEIKLVILSRFDLPESSLREEILPADGELAERLSQFMRKRCLENKHKLKIIQAAQVRNYQLKEPDATPVEIGNHFKADYVLELTIESLSLSEKNYVPKMFYGKTRVAINLYKTDAKEDEQRVFDKYFHCEYPGSRGPIPAGDTRPEEFRALFLTKVARDLSKMFIAYPPEENRILD